MKVQIFKVKGDSFSSYEFFQKYKGGKKIAVSFKIGKKRKLRKFVVRYAFEARDEREMNEMELIRGDGTPNKRYFSDLVSFKDLEK